MRPRRQKNEINVVPYIDVMLVLLVIFMVTAPMMTTASIDVPSVGKAAQVPSEALQVNIRAGALPEIWSYGHRNAQGATLAPDGSLWMHEHGPQGGDEINIPKPGANYGWPVIT